MFKYSSFLPVKAFAAFINNCITDPYYSIFATEIISLKSANLYKWIWLNFGAKLKQTNIFKTLYPGLSADNQQGNGRSEADSPVTPSNVWQVRSKKSNIFMNNVFTDLEKYSWWKWKNCTGETCCHTGNYCGRVWLW